jgi:hypothetical protein
VEVCIPALLERIFDGKQDVEAHPLFQGVPDLPDWFRGPAVLTTVFVDPVTGKLERCLPAMDGFIGRGVEKEGQNPRLVHWVKNSYGHTIFCPEQKAGPDAVTVVHFKRGDILKLLTGQIKYEVADYASAKTESAFASLSSDRFGAGAQELLEGPYKRAEGILQFLIMFPAVCLSEATCVVQEDRYERGVAIRTGKKQKLLSRKGDVRVIIDKNNSADFFDDDFMRLLASLKLERPQPLADESNLRTAWDAETV